MRGRLYGGGSAVLAIGVIGLIALEWPHGPQIALALSTPVGMGQLGSVPLAVAVPVTPDQAIAPAGAHLAPRPKPAAPAAAPPLVIGSYQQVLINSDRARAGLGPLTWSSCLLSVAVANARRMAAQGYISHTNGAYADLNCRLGAQGGENVGWWSGGINDVQLNSMFMASPDHRANIMGPYHYVASAWAVGANGYAYIAVEFT